MLTQSEATPKPGILAASASRRKFLQGAGIAASAATLAGCGGIIGVDPSNGPAPSIADVFQFALNLEYFEATFYSYVVTGQGLAAADIGPNPGTVTGGAKVNFSDPLVAAIAQQLYQDEQAHVRYIRAALQYAGVTPISIPNLNLAAGGPVTDDASFLAAARRFETVGTSAYEGAVQYVALQPQAVTYAAIIHDAEAQHESALRQFCLRNNVSSPAVDQFDHPPALNEQRIFNTSDITGLNTARNASEVLQILYAAPGKTGVSSGGFFPNGLNGNVKTT